MPREDYATRAIHATHILACGVASISNGVTPTAILADILGGGIRRKEGRIDTNRHNLLVHYTTTLVCIFVSDIRAYVE